MDEVNPGNLATAFGIWASVVAIASAGIVYELIRLRGQFARMSEQLHRYVVSMERRVTVIETHFGLMNHGFRPYGGDGE